MAECNITPFPTYSGEAVCTGATEQEKMDRWCAWNAYFRDTFTPAVGTFTTELQTCTTWISEQVATVATDKQIVLDAKEAVVSTIGNTFVSTGWNATDDFVGKIVVHNDIVFASIASPNVNHEPTTTDSYWQILGSQPIDYITVTTDRTAVVKEYLLVDTTANVINITLPASPNNRDEIVLHDIKDNFEVNNCNVLRNGNTIMQIEEDWTLDKKSINVKFVFLNNDWRIL